MAIMRVPLWRSDSCEALTLRSTARGVVGFVWRQSPA
jgi:hypothetical protein